GRDRTVAGSRDRSAAAARGRALAPPGPPAHASRAERAMRAFEAFGGRCSNLDDRGQADRQDLHADLVELDDDLLIGPRHRALQDGAAAPGAMLHLVSRSKSLNQLDRRGWAGGLDQTGGRHAGVGYASRKSGGRINQVKGNVLEKARGEVQVRAAPEMAAERVKQIEPVLRPRHSHVGERACRLQVGERIEAAAVPDVSSLQGEPQAVWELAPLH